MPQASRVLAGLLRDGWVEVRRSGSHRTLVKGDQQRVWAYHDGVDLGGPAMARIARKLGYTVEQLAPAVGESIDVSVSLRVEYFYDDESHSWHFQVPALNIIGGGQATRQEAERACLDAIEYALQGNASDYDRDALAVTFTVDIHAA